MKWTSTIIAEILHHVHICKQNFNYLGSKRIIYFSPIDIETSQSCVKTLQHEDWDCAK